MAKKIVLTTLSREGEYLTWLAPEFFKVERVNKYMPLGVLSLATNLPEEYEVTVIDPSSEGWTIKKTLSIITK